MSESIYKREGVNLLATDPDSVLFQPRMPKSMQNPDLTFEQFLECLEKWGARHKFAKFKVVLKGSRIDEDGQTRLQLSQPKWQKPTTVDEDLEKLTR